METAHIVSSQYAPEALLFAGIAGHTMLVRREFLQREEIWVDKFSMTGVLPSVPTSTTIGALSK